MTARARRQGAAPILVPETGILHQTVNRLPVTNHFLLGSWIVDTCQEGHNLRSAPQRRHMAHLGNRATRTGVVIKTHSPPGTVHLPYTWLSEPSVETWVLYLSSIPDTQYPTLVTSSYNILLVGMSIDKHSGVALCHQSVTHTRLLLHCESRFSTHPSRSSPKAAFFLGIHFSSTSRNCP